MDSRFVSQSLALFNELGFSFSSDSYSTKTFCLQRNPRFWFSGKRFSTLIVFFVNSLLLPVYINVLISPSGKWNFEFQYEFTSESAWWNFTVHWINSQFISFDGRTYFVLIVPKRLLIIFFGNYASVMTKWNFNSKFIKFIWTIFSLYFIRSCFQVYYVRIFSFFGLVSDFSQILQLSFFRQTFHKFFHDESVPLKSELGQQDHQILSH